MGFVVRVEGDNAGGVEQLQFHHGNGVVQDAQNCIAGVLQCLEAGNAGADMRGERLQPKSS